MFDLTRFSSLSPLPFPELQEGFTDTTTPWHSDEAYWLDLADKRALSFWFPMQDVNVGISKDIKLRSGLSSLYDE